MTNMSITSIKNLVLILIILLGYGCAENSSLTLDILKNSEYKGIYETPLKLTDGTYEGEPFVKGGASRADVDLVDSFTRFGDLNGDGVKDAVAILRENSGGSGTFVYLCAVISKDTKAINIATLSLNDRTQIDSITIDSGEIVLTLLTHGPKDPMCCPSQKEIRKYQLENNTLIMR